jgi:hypothetical protein
MNWSLEQTLEQLRTWKASPKQRLYVVFTWGDVRVSSVCSVAELNEEGAVVVLGFGGGGGGIRLPLRDVKDFKFSSASEAMFDIRAITEERFPRALFLSFAFSSAKCAIAEVADNVAML